MLFMVALLWPLQGLLALNCFEEGPDISLRVIGCAYFAFGNTQVCYTKRILAKSSDNLLDVNQDAEESFGGGQQRGCQYLSRLGKFLTKVQRLKSYISFTGVDLGPAKNLSQDLHCASRPWPEDERYRQEICACINDLCNVAASNTSSSIISPPKRSPNLGVTLTFHTAFLLFSVFIAS